MVELRKRKTPPPAPAKPVKKAAKAKTEGKKEPAPEAEKKADAKPEAAPEVAKEAAASKPKSKASSAKAGDTIDFEGFGGEIQTNDGESTTLKELVEKSKSGVVLFTYPKASTPGCTNQACMFRDSYEPLTATGLSIFGLSKDSPKANTTFKTKQNLPYSLLCDPSSTLIAAIGLNESGKTKRGVFVVTKEGKVLAAEPGGPAATVDVVKGLVDKVKAE